LSSSPFSISNVRLFIIFRIFFNARFYYPVFTVLFLDFGLSLEQFAILNSVWAAAIVLLEVPSGALADTIGRRNLLRMSAVFMFFEMAIICFLPIGNNKLVFWGFVINRILSGAAEASASGADEALAYDSLEKQGLAESWPKVLEFLMRWQSIAFIFALLAGSFVYDANSLNSFFVFFGIHSRLTSEVTMRFPLYLVLLSSLVVLVVTFRMQEVAHAGSDQIEQKVYVRCSEAMSKMYSAAKWILANPFALSVICAGLLFDNVIRMVMTLNSQYYRTIELPAWSYGMLGAAFSLIGFLVPSIASQLLQKCKPTTNFLILAFVTFLGLFGMTLVWPIAGLLPFGMVYSVMYFVGFMISNYLNQTAPSDMRATILSFKGLAFNLAYGLIGILYSLLARNLAHAIPATMPGLDAVALNKEVFVAGLQYFPYYFLITCMVFVSICAFTSKSIKQR